MDPVTIATSITSICSLIAAIAAASGQVKRNELDALQRQVDRLEKDLEEERAAHAKTRKTLNELQEAYDELHKQQRRAAPRHNHEADHA